METDVLREELFAENVKTKFRVAAEGGREVELELTEVASYRSNDGDQKGLERFSAFFEGPADPFIGQGTFTFEHERMGSFLLFITPIAKTDRGVRYEAVVNRMKNSES